MVHTFGGVAAFIGALMLGPRIGRFDANGKPVPIPGHSVPVSLKLCPNFPITHVCVSAIISGQSMSKRYSQFNICFHVLLQLTSLGAFILVMGFFSFNGGSLGQISKVKYR